MAQNEPQRKETPPGPSPNSPPLLFEYQCRSGKFIRLANRIEKIDSVARIESNRNFASASEVTTLWRYTNLFIIIIILLFFARIGMLYRTELPILKSVYNFSSSDALNTV